MVTEERVRVDYNAAKSLVERVGSVVEILGTSRDRFLLNTLEDKLEELANDEEFRRRLSDAYNDGRIDYETVSPETCPAVPAYHR